MLVTLKEMLDKALAGKYAVGAFNVPNLESIRAVISAAEELDVPVILQHAEPHEGMVHLEEIGPIMLDYARRSSVPVCVHLDHGASFDLIIKAIRLGFSSVMIDASSKPYEENMAITKQIVQISHAVNVSVESELGAMFNSTLGNGGREATSASDFASLDDCYTNPQQAREFVEQTGVDALAIAFGTVHGVYVTKPVLDLNRIAMIRKQINVPLVMHGGSGVSDADFKVAINNGITKVNYYTYGTMAGANAVREYLSGKKPDEKIFYHDIIDVATKGIKENVKAAMKVFANKD